MLQGESTWGCVEIGSSQKSEGKKGGLGVVPSEMAALSGYRCPHG